MESIECDWNGSGWDRFDGCRYVVTTKRKTIISYEHEVFAGTNNYGGNSNNSISSSSSSCNSKTIYDGNNVDRDHDDGEIKFIIYKRDTKP